MLLVLVTGLQIANQSPILYEEISSTQTTSAVMNNLGHPPLSFSPYHAPPVSFGRPLPFVFPSSCSLPLSFPLRFALFPFVPYAAKFYLQLARSSS
jgi:hypothetical protein